MSKYEYKLLGVYNGGLEKLSDLNVQIAQHISDGWLPAGPPVISGTGAGGGSYAIAPVSILQPMSRTKEDRLPEAPKCTIEEVEERKPETTLEDRILEYIGAISVDRIDLIRAFVTRFNYREYDVIRVVENLMFNNKVHWDSMRNTLRRK